jgi:hypothetical protein
LIDGQLVNESSFTGSHQDAYGVAIGSSVVSWINQVACSLRASGKNDREPSGIRPDFSFFPVALRTRIGRVARSYQYTAGIPPKGKAPRRVRSHFLEARSPLEPDGETNGLIAALGRRSHSAAVQTIESAAESEIGPICHPLPAPRGEGETPSPSRVGGEGARRADEWALPVPSAGVRNSTVQRSSQSDIGRNSKDGGSVEKLVEQLKTGAGKL